MSDPLRLCLALGPLALYLLVIGTLNLLRRPTVVSGARDLAALGVGVSGLVVVGPLELLLPRAAAISFGPYVWLMLLTLYSLSLSLVALLVRPRLVIYNACSLEVFRPVMARVIEELDSRASWAGRCLSLPSCHVELTLEYHPVLRNISLCATHDQQSDEGWRRLHAALTRQLHQVERRTNPWGLGLTLLSLALLIGLTSQLAARPAEVSQALREMLRL